MASQFFRLTSLLGLVFFACLGSANAECQRFKGFKSNSDGTVTDPRTNLTWTKCNVGQSISENGNCVGAAVPVSLFDAVSVTGPKYDIAQDDWRIPTSVELISILDRSCKNKKTNSKVLSIPAKAANYWSSERAGYGTSVWYVNGNSGDLNLTMDLSDKKFIRLVKGGSLESRKLFLGNSRYLIDSAPSLKAWEADRQQARDDNEALQKLFNAACIRRKLQRSV